MPTLDFSDRIFIITGAASGIGRELALQAARAGARVIGVDWNEGGLHETARLSQQAGTPIEPHVVDLSQVKELETFVAALLPGLDQRPLVLINNAGVALNGGTFAETTLADFDWLLQINLWAAIRLCKAFYPHLLRTGRGHIVNISSVFGLIGVARNTAYCTAKFALRGFTESIRMELRETGIRTTTVHPGGIRTGIVRNARRVGISAEAHDRSIQAFERLAPTSAARAAAQILQAVHRGRERLVIGPDGKAIDWLARLLPVGYTGIALRRLRKTFGED